MHQGIWVAKEREGVDASAMARICSTLMLFLVAFSVNAGSARIIKVLPHYLDLKGRHSLSPSLYERDAYQAELRSNMDKVSGIRFDINWSSKGVESENLKIRVEVKGSDTPAGEAVVVELTSPKKKLMGNWAGLVFEGDSFKKVGKVIAWRATIWDGEEQVARKQSFLW